MTELWVRSSVWIERLPPEEKVVSSSLAGLIVGKPSSDGLFSSLMTPCLLGKKVGTLEL